MNELSNRVTQLPDTLEDLSKFVLVGREKLNAVRAEIRAIEKVGLAKEVHEQKLAEAQDIADAVLDAEVKIGELTSQMTTVQGQRSDLKLIPNGGEKSKSEQLADLGIKHHERFERLASHPETVRKAKEDARAEGRIVTRQDVLNRIVVPNKNKSIKETIQDAKDQHEEFKQAKHETIVSIDAIRQDKENEEIVNRETEIKIRKALQAVGSLLIVSNDELQEMSEGMTDMAKRCLCDSVRQGIKLLIHITNYLGG